jgi:DNA-binding transcriptional regulator YhcF (GntR family)
MEHASASGRVLTVSAVHKRSRVIFVVKVPKFDANALGPVYIYIGVADHIAARIEAGELPTGARLPAERDLAADYQVAVGTARRAVEELRQRGLVVTLPAKGTFIM